MDLDLYCQEADEYISIAEIDSMVAKDETIIKPENFKYSIWNQWEESQSICI